MKNTEYTLKQLDEKKYKSFKISEMGSEEILFKKLTNGDLLIGYDGMSICLDEEQLRHLKQVIQLFYDSDEMIFKKETLNKWGEE